MRKAIFIVLVVTCWLVVEPAHGTTYYVDYSSGADTNNGTSKMVPWKHAPGMLGLNVSGGSTGDGCTAVCASTRISPGDSIILKGGTVWPYTVLPWQPSYSGNASSSVYGCQGAGCVYTGYDPTWNQGIVNSVTLTRDLGGCSASSAPTVSFSGGGGSGAAATAHVISSATGTQEPNVAGFVYYVGMTNRGSGYTSNPTVTISGDSCTGITAVADITRPIIDAGSGSSVLWQVGYGAGATEWGPGLTPQGASYDIFDHLEIRNILQVARAVNGVPDGVITAFLGNEGGGSGHITYSNNYLHGRFTNCTLQSCIGGWPSNDQEQADRAIILNNANDEADYNVVSNGDGYFTGTSSTTCGTNAPCEFSEHSIYDGTAGGSIHNNYIYVTRWWTHAGGTGSTPALIDNNEMWLSIYDVGSAHVNELYTLLTTGSLYEYNNIFHSAVSGSSNQQQMGNGTTQYFFNNVSWGLGGGTSNWGIDANFGAGPSGGHFYFFNNTMYGEATGTRDCIDGGGAFGAYLTTVLQNNHCVTAATPYYVEPSGANYTNEAGSTTTAAIDSTSTMQSPSTAASQGYTQANLYAPTSSGNDTVTFSGSANSANLTSLCSGNLITLCSDINGNARPTSGGWQSGAYQYSANSAASSAMQVAAPSGLVATVQ